MKISIRPGQVMAEPEVVINCASNDAHVQQIVTALKRINAKLLCRRQGESISVCISDILYIESVDRKTFLYTEDQVYEIDKRLYELEKHPGRPLLLPGIKGYHHQSEASPFSAAGIWLSPPAHHG